MGTGDDNDSSLLGDLTGLQDARSTAVFLEVAFDAVVTFDTREKITSWNQAAEKMFGWTAQEAMGKTPAELFWPVDVPLRNEYKNQRQTRLRRGETLQGELIPYRKDGSSFPAQFTARAIFDPGGGLCGYLAVYRDISDKVQARKKEEQLQQSNQRFNEILASIQDDFYVLNRDWKFVFASRTFTSRIGREPEDFVGHNIWEMFPNHVGGTLYENFHIAMEQREVRRFEIPGRYTSAWYRMTAFPSEEGITVIGTDISERKKAEDALRQSQKTFQELIERAPFGVYVVDSQFRIAHMNASSQTGAFRNVRPVIGRDFGEAMRILWPEETASGIISAFRHTLETGESYYSPRFTNTRQDVAVVESYEWELHRMMLPDGQYGVICYYYDSTKLRDAETARRESEERFSKAFHASPVGINIFRLQDAQSIDVNEAFLDLTGYSRDEVIGHTSAELNIFVNPNQRTAMLQELQEQGTVRNLEIEVRHKSGTVLNTLFSIVRIELNGEACGLVLATDITARKQAENALRENQAVLQSFYDSAPFMMGIAELDGDSSTLISGNQALAEFFASQPKNMRGRESSELGTPIDVERMWMEKYRQSHDQGAPVRFEHEYPHLGSGRWFQSTVSFIEIGPSGKPRFSFVTEDITGRKQAEMALLEKEEQLQHLNDSLEQQVQEKTAEVRHLAADLVIAVQRERHRISHILHDDLQQRIYAILMQLTFLQNELNKVNEAAQNEALDTEKQLNEVLEITRNLSIDLSPPILQDEGLTQAISWLAGQMKQRYGLPIEVQADGSFIVPDEELQVLLFNCVRELLFNVVKHAEASLAVVRLQWLNDSLQIEVYDDGKGFQVQMEDQPSAEEISEEENLQVSFGLPTLRYQLLLFDGRMEIESEPGTGACVKITVPVAKTV